MYMKRLINKIVEIDNKALNFFNRNSKPALAKIFSKLTLLGNGGVYAIIIFIVMFLYPLTRYQSYLIGVASGINAIVVNLIIKRIAKRTRPFNLNDIDIMIAHPKDYSFPSGHTSITAAATVVLIYYGIYYNIGVWFIILNILFLFLMGLSRLYLKVHFLSDVIVGGIIGLFIGLMTILFREQICFISNSIVEYIFTFGSK